MIVFNNNNNNPRGGRPASTREGTPNSMAGPYRLCRPFTSSIRSWAFPLPATQPYSVTTLHIHGVPAYGRYHKGCLTRAT